jgi:hypothetical protein
MTEVLLWLANLRRRKRNGGSDHGVQSEDEPMTEEGNDSG